MQGTSYNHEEQVRTAEHAGGYPKHYPLKLTDGLRDNSNLLALVGAATVPGLLAGVLSSGSPVVDQTGQSLEYAGSEGGDDYLYFVWQVPEDYDEEKDAFELVGWVWKHDTTGSATENADCAIVAKIFMSETNSETADTLVGTVPGTTTALHTIQAKSATADWRRFALDFSRNTPLAKNRRNALQRGDLVYIQIDLNEDIGSNLAVLLRGFGINYRGSSAVWNKQARQEFGNA